MQTQIEPEYPQNRMVAAAFKVNDQPKFSNWLKEFFLTDRGMAITLTTDRVKREDNSDFDRASQKLRDELRKISEYRKKMADQMFANAEMSRTEIDGMKPSNT